MQRVVSDSTLPHNTHKNTRARARTHTHRQCNTHTEGMLEGIDMYTHTSIK